MKFLSDTRHEELEAKEMRCDYLESQNKHLLHKCRELSAEVAILKQNKYNREKMISFNESMEIQKDSTTGQEIREYKKVTRTIVQPEEESLPDFLKNSPFIGK